MRQINLLVAAVILALLSGAVWWAKKHPESATTNAPAVAATPKLADIPAAQVQEIDLKKKDGPDLILKRQNNKWALTSPEALPTDQAAVDGIVSSLNPVNADNLVEEKATDLSKYGLNSPSLTVTVHEKSGKSDVIDFGDNIPAGSLVYARAGSSSKIYAVPSSAKTAFDKSENDLRDKRLLTFDQNQLTRLELTSGKSDIEFGKNNLGDWQIVKPQPYRADNFQVEELLRKLSEAKMDLAGSVDDTKKMGAAYASGEPVATAKATDSAGTQTLSIRKNKDDYYAMSSVVNGIYKVSADLGKELDKSLEDFRNKKIFDFGFSDPTKIDVQQGGSDKVYVRSGSDWKVNGKVMDAGSVQAFIDKLRDLAATKFVNAGFTSPEDTVTVTSNDGKRVERAEFAKTSDGYIVRRGNEPALYQLDAKSANDMLEASRAIKQTASSAKK